MRFMEVSRRKLSKLQRRQAYKVIRAQICIGDNKEGLCVKLLRYSRQAYGNRANLDEFPELLAQQPVNMQVNSYWWPFTIEGNRARIQTLTNCISLTSDIPY